MITFFEFEVIIFQSKWRENLVQKSKIQLKTNTKIATRSLAGV
jgi:hypothetical protein